jgi:hypothetical protein
MPMLANNKIGQRIIENYYKTTIKNKAPIYKATYYNLLSRGKDPNYVNNMVPSIAKKLINKYHKYTSKYAAI